MILDANNIWSDQQAITATAASTNVLDLGAAGTPFGSPVALTPDIGKEFDIPIAIICQQAFNNLTSLTVAFQTATDAAFTTPVEVATRTYLAAELAAVGLLNFPARVPQGTNLRFTRLLYTVTGTAPTTGKVFAGIVAARQTNDH